MTNAIDNAVTRLQNIAAALTSVPPTGTVIHAESDYPTEAAQPFPFSVCFLVGGRLRSTNKTVFHNFPTVRMEFHFSRVNLRMTEQQVRAVAYEFPARLAGDPTLDGSVNTIVFGQENEIEYNVRGEFEYGQIKSYMLEMFIPLKILQAPESTST